MDYVENYEDELAGYLSPEFTTPSDFNDVMNTANLQI